MIIPAVTINYIFTCQWSAKARVTAIAFCPRSWKCLVPKGRQSGKIPAQIKYGTCRKRCLCMNEPYANDLLMWHRHCFRVLSKMWLPWREWQRKKTVQNGLPPACWVQMLRKNVSKLLIRWDPMNWRLTRPLRSDSSWPIASLPLMSCFDCQRLADRCQV